MNTMHNYRNYLIQNNKSPNTISSYIRNVTEYLSSYPTLSRENIQSYKSKISHLASTTQNHKLSSLKNYNEYLLSINQIDSIYIIKSDFIKIQSKGNPTTVTQSDVSKFLSKVESRQTTDLYKSRNKAIIILVANSGIRRDEVTNIKLKDIDLEAGEVLITKGKGNKERTVIINTTTITTIKEYLSDRNKYKYNDSPYLFVSKKGNKLDKGSINDIFELYTTPKCKVAPHQLRHNFATTTLEQGVYTLPELQNQLGHSSISTTGIYAHARKENMKKKVNQLRIG